MFFKKKEEAFFERMEEKLKNLEDGIAAGNRQSEELTEKIGRLQTTVQKHANIHYQQLKRFIYTSSAYLCIQMIDRSHDNIHT